MAAGGKVWQPRPPLCSKAEAAAATEDAEGQGWAVEDAGLPTATYCHVHKTSKEQLVCALHLQSCKHPSSSGPLEMQTPSCGS